jgi:Holliday junction resolvase RusA-like endonuclease
VGVGGEGGFLPQEAISHGSLRRQHFLPAPDSRVTRFKISCHSVNDMIKLCVDFMKLLLMHLSCQKVVYLKFKFHWKKRQQVRVKIPACPGGAPVSTIL